MPERVTTVCSFRPKNPLLVDDMTNKNIRNKSHLSELYYQWTTYRLEVISQRAILASEALKKRYEDNVQKSDPSGRPGMCLIETVKEEEMKRFSQDMMDYIQHTMKEMQWSLQ